jgi:beta-glucosidase/6-phospho-beta-glucosidase/beta-galactosidase
MLSVPQHTISCLSLLHVQVKWWNTINEPQIFAMGYSVPFGFAPNILTPGHGQYLAVHTALLSHARAYRLYEREFKDKQGGECCAF